MSAGAAGRSGLRPSGSAENGGTNGRAALILARGRIEFDNMAVVSRADVRDHRCIDGRNEAVDRHDRARRLRQCAKHAWRFWTRPLVRQTLIIRRSAATAMTNDEQTARGRIAGRSKMRTSHSTQQYLQRERIGRDHGDPWSHAFSSFAALQHDVIPRPCLISIVGGKAEDDGCGSRQISVSLCDGIATTAPQISAHDLLSFHAAAFASPAPSYLPMTFSAAAMRLIFGFCTQ